MSLSTPPPCRSPRQNHGACGPLCSSAARARYGRPVAAAPRDHRSARPPVSAERRVDSPGTRGRARRRARAPSSAGFGDRARKRLLAGDAAQRAAAALEGVDDLLHVLDAFVVRTAEPERVDGRVATMSPIEAYGFASPTSSARARVAASAALSGFGLQTPRTSASRTARNACR